MKSVQGFDLVYLFAESRLGDVQSVGGPSEVQLFCQDDDCVEVTNFDPGEHRSTPFTCGGDRQPPTSSKGTSTRGKAAKQSRDTLRKRIPPYKNILMLFPLNLFLS